MLRLEKTHFKALLDMTAELNIPETEYLITHNLPWLDLIEPELSQLHEAAQYIELLRLQGPLLICCALGYARSATALIAWLLLTGRENSVDRAIALIVTLRPEIVIKSVTYGKLKKLEKEIM